MKFLTYLVFIAFATSSCQYSKQIFIRDDGTAKIYQSLHDEKEAAKKFRNRDYWAYYEKYQKPPQDTSIHPWLFDEYFDKECNTACIKKKIDTYNGVPSAYPGYTITVNTVDSIGNYLAGYPHGYIEFKKLSDQLFLIRTEEKPPSKDANSDFKKNPLWINLSFDRPVKSYASTTAKNNLKMNKRLGKIDPTTVSIRIPPINRGTRRGHRLLVVIELEKD